jgi:hypothetical protein
MTYHRLPYEDADTPREMSVDAHEVEHNLRLGHPDVAVRPSELLGEAPLPATDRLHSRYEVSADLARMVDGLELHFD